MPLSDEPMRQLLDDLERRGDDEPLRVRLYTSDEPEPGGWPVIGTWRGPRAAAAEVVEDEGLTTPVESPGDTAPQSLSRPAGQLVVAPRPSHVGVEHEPCRCWGLGRKLALCLFGVALGYAIGMVTAPVPTRYLSPTTGEPVPLGVVPERGTSSVWAPGAPTLRIPVLEVEAPLGVGTDGGPGPVVLEGTPWPGEPGRSVLLVNANLEPLQAGDLIEVEGTGRWRVTTTVVLGEGDLDAATMQPPAGGVELVLLEALDVHRDEGRVLVRTWRVQG